jgi:hypothetical protein
MVAVTATLRAGGGIRDPKSGSRSSQKIKKKRALFVGRSRSRDGIKGTFFYRLNSLETFASRISGNVNAAPVQRF